MSDERLIYDSKGNIVGRVVRDVGSDGRAEDHVYDSMGTLTHRVERNEPNAWAGFTDNQLQRMYEAGRENATILPPRPLAPSRIRRVTATVVVLTASFVLPFLLHPVVARHGHAAHRDMLWAVVIVLPLLKRWFAPNARKSYGVQPRENAAVELVMFFIICSLLATLGDGFGSYR